MFAETISLRSRRPLSTTAVISVAFHLAAALAFIGYSSWHLQRLEPREAPVFTLAGLPTPPLAEQPPGPIAVNKAPASHKVAAVTPRPPSEPTQPTAEVVPAEAAEPGGPEGVMNGLPGGIPGMSGTNPDGDVTAPPGPGGGDRLEPRPAVKAEVVDSAMMEGLRVAGSSQLVLPVPLLSSLRAQGLDVVTVTARICVDERGAVSKISLNSRPDQADVEAVVRAGVSAWRYQPFRAGGTAVPACFGKTFRYQIVE